MPSVKAPTLGKQAKSDLPESLFTESFHESLVHDTARAEANARRRGTASSLGRGEVSMTGAKAWKQKGTGRARAGALGVPHRRGGGAAFGPKPRGYTFKVNRKARRKALRAALSVHADRGSVAVLDAAAYDEPSTKKAAEAIGKWDPRLPILLVLDAEETAIAKSFRNIPRINVLPAQATGVVDIIGHRSLLVTQAALETLEARAADVTRSSAAKPAQTTPTESSASRPVQSGQGADGEAGSAREGDS